MSDNELFDWPDRDPGELLPEDPYSRWEDSDTMGLDESGYFRELGRRLAARQR